MLDSSISDYEIKINGYDIVRKDRNRHGGGVAIDLRNSLEGLLWGGISPKIAQNRGLKLSNFS
jgi:hypothetical protein